MIRLDDTFFYSVGRRCHFATLSQIAAQNTCATSLVRHHHSTRQNISQLLTDKLTTIIEFFV